jgi:hypothetical protein
MRDDFERDVTYIGPRAFAGGFAALCLLFVGVAYGASRITESLDAAPPTAPVIASTPAAATAMAPPVASPSPAPGPDALRAPVAAPAAFAPARKPEIRSRAQPVTATMKARVIVTRAHPVIAANAQRVFAARAPRRIAPSAPHRVSSSSPQGVVRATQLVQPTVGMDARRSVRAVSAPRSARRPPLSSVKAAVPRAIAPAPSARNEPAHGLLMPFNSTSGFALGGGLDPRRSGHAGLVITPPAAAPPIAAQPQASP